MEKDLKIYQELSAAAVTVFNEGIDAPAGIYKLSELAKVGTTSKTAPKGVFFRSDYDTDKAITLSVEDFICSFPACQVFRLAHRFETLAQVGAKDRAIFTREAARGELVAVVSFGAATVEDLKACADKKSIRERMKGVFIDVAAGMSCCSDGRALNVSRLVHAQAFDLDALNYGGVILPRDFVKAAKGCEISIYKDNEEIIAVASNGATCNAIPGYYPNFKSVFSHVDASRAVQFKNIRALQKAAMAVAKTTNNNKVFISGLNSDQFITVSANGEGGEIARRVDLSSPLAFNFAIKCEATELKKINSAVNAFYIALSGNFSFIGEKTISGLCHHFFENATPTAEAAAQNADPGDCELNIFEAFAASVAPVAPAEVAVKEENIAASVAPFVPAEDAVKEENAATVAPVAPAEVAVKEENIAATVAPAEDAMKEGNNAATVAPVDPSEDAVKEGNNAASVTPVAPSEDAAKEDNNAASVVPWRSVCFKLLQIAAAFVCFILFNISIKGDVAAVSLLNNVSFAPCADRAAARASPGATPDELDGSKQIPERADNTAAPDAMPP